MDTEMKSVEGPNWKIYEEVWLMKRRYGEEMRPQEDMEVFIDRLIEGKNLPLWFRLTDSKEWIAYW